MKRNEFKLLREKTQDELEQMINTKRVEISKAKAELGSGKVKNVRLVKNLRNDLAKIKTLEREKERKEPK